MCGRFSLNITLEQIQQHFSVDVVTCEWEPRPEVFPSQQVPAIITREAEGEIRDIHDRMPCVLTPEDWGNWLDPSYRDVHSLKKVLHHCCDLFRFQSR